MRGRQVFLETLLAHGVDRIFGNPGTTESPLLNSLLDYPQLQYIVHLHEGVAVGAANFYGQASGKTAFVNLHVAPGPGQRRRHDLRRAQEQHADGRDGGPAGHAPPAARSRAGPRSRGDRGAGHQMERAGRARRRDGTDPAARLQDRQRGAGRAGVRGAAHQRHGAGNQRAARQARAPLRGEPPRSRRHRGHGEAADRRQEPGHRGRRRGRARRCRQDAGQAGREASAPRCGSRACAGAMRFRPIIPRGAARSPSMRRASPSSSPTTTWC